MSTHSTDPQRGDVESVEFADETKAAAAVAARKLSDHIEQLRQSPMPAPDERVRIRLAGHPFTFTVRVRADPTTGPQLTEFTATGDDGEVVTHAALRSVPLRRLAYSAYQWISRHGGLIGTAGDYRETDTRPEVADPRLTELHWRIEQAIMAGDPVRPTVAADLGVSTKTLDRMIAKARAEGLLEGVELSRRPSPRQRDALRARDLAEQWLTEHGPHAQPPPELVAEIRRLQGDDAGAESPPPPTTPATKRRPRKDTKKR